MALVLNFSTFRDETLATFLTATLDQIASSLGSHASAKTVLTLTRAF